MRIRLSVLIGKERSYGKGFIDKQDLKKEVTVDKREKKKNKWR